MPNFITEDQIERALLQKLQHLHGYEVLNCFTENPEDLDDDSGRTDKRDVILLDRVREAAVELNPDLPGAVIDGALERLTDRRPAMSPLAANQEVYDLLRNGIPVEFDDAQGRRREERLRVIDFHTPGRNHYLAVAQLWIKGAVRYRRPDVLLYVNGVPLVFIELKNSNVSLKAAFDDNLTNYRREIPQLFLTNAFCVLSNAVETKVGSMTAEWEHFFNWLRVSDEKEKVDRAAIREKSISLERVVEGLLPAVPLLDYVENFILFYRDSQKIVAQNHQFIGVNKAYARFQRREEQGGKLGVFWHTQGSGKSFSMIFYARKIMHKQAGNFTFVVVTDREDLDSQIYRNFLHTGTVKKSDTAQPRDSEEMRKFLGQNKRLVFTLIHKFRWDKGTPYPLLSDRRDIVVIVDEAHRTQYQSLAENMRAGLPKAQYLAFTGTPLLGTERKTNAWFGEYVSEYNFRQSVDDGATVPLFYSKRVPQLSMQNENLDVEFCEIVEDENLTAAQRSRLENKYAAEISVLKNDDRLEAIAKDIVHHFPSRGYLGKGLVVSLDKFTAVKMFDKVQRLWKARIKELVGRSRKSKDEIEKDRIKKIVDYMRAVEMAVVVSEEADEEKLFRAQGLDITVHRQRMNAIDKHGHDLEYNFKDVPDHPVQLVFVCAMWLTGFDVPTLSTLYLDKPMQGHTLMQAIARANRVTSWRVNGVEKRNGEIIDYYNVFRDMKRALIDYAEGGKGEAAPVQNKTALFKLLDDAVAQGMTFCRDLGLHLDDLLAAKDVFKKIEIFEEYADRLLTKDEHRKSFAVYENTITGLYEACKPEILGKPVVRSVAIFQYLRGVVDGITEQTDLAQVGKRVAGLLDESLVVDEAQAVRDAGGEFRIAQSGKAWDLSTLNVATLRKDFKEARHPHIEIADLRAFIRVKLEQMLKQNASRSSFAERLQRIIDTYNSGSSSADNSYEELLRFAQALQQEAERHLREGLSEDELEIFDLLKKEKMTKPEEQRVKLAARSLLERLTRGRPKVLVQDWYRDSMTKTAVRSAIEEVLDQSLPQESYDRILFKRKCDTVYDLILEYASRGLKWAA